MSTLSLKNLNKIYQNKVQAVFDFNLDIKDREFIVLVGPSGCGKSTTLRMIAGLENISSGELYIDNEFMNNVEPKDRNIAMVFQSYALYPQMSVYENIKFALKLRKIPTPVYEKKPINPEYLKKRKQILKEIKKYKSKAKKDLVSKELLEKRNALYDNLYKLQEDIKASQIQKVDYDDYKVFLLEHEISVLNKKIIHSTKEEKSHIEKSINEKNNQIDYLKNNKTPIFVNKKPSKLEMDIEINKIAEQIDLVPYLYRKPAALSGGQRQRVALGRAMVRKPKVFLMDEPLSNLDAKLRVQTRNEIRKLHDKVGATTIYVTHDQTEAMTMADRIVIMKDGYVQQIGSPNDVYKNPKNKFVGSFIGAYPMNFIDVIYNNGNLEISKDYKLTVNSQLKSKLNKYEGKTIILGVRPSEVKLESDNTKPSIKCSVSNLELIGEELLAYTNFNGIKLLTEAENQEELAKKKNIEISFDINKVYLFDKDTELRI